jgi:small subunit ribosomal protein S16
MSVRIRLRRVGRKKQPYYRLVVTEKHSPRDGAYIENVGFYNPRLQPAELQLDLARLDHWLERGAELSESAASLVRKARKGGDRKVALVSPAVATSAAAAAAPAAPVAPAAPAAPVRGSRGKSAAAQPAASAAVAEPEPAAAPESVAAVAPEEAPVAGAEAEEPSAEEPRQD